VSTPASPLPQVVLKPRRALPFFSRHPWVFAGAIGQVVGNPEPGDEVDLLSHERQFIARGLYNPNSNIRMRLYSWNAEAALDADFWSARLDAALALRNRLIRKEGADVAQRLVYSEADGLSGLIVDRYADWLLVQLTSLALATRQDLLLTLLKDKLQPKGIWLRTEKGIRESEGLELSDGPLDGGEPPRPLFIEEHGVRYGVDLLHGQKTGFYLDQSDNRLAVARYTAGHRMLDMFCYTGGFGLTALVRGNAHDVLGIDVSEQSLNLAWANAELNGVSNRCRYEKSDAFEKLEQLRDAGEQFDTVVLDPPKLARHRAGVDKALKGYFSLNELAVSVLRPDGLLVTCSCSGHVSREQFEDMLGSVAQRTDRTIQILESRSQSPDHPTSVHCPETRYLKCYICRVR
jgi:23S rRNA (cytosine1962-C5)-methyltransferase